MANVVQAPPPQVTMVRFLQESTDRLAEGGQVKLPPIPSRVIFKAGENINAIEITFSRAVIWAGLTKSGTPQSIYIEQLAAGVRSKMLAGNLTLGAPSVALWTSADSPFGPGNYRLTVLGDPIENRSAITAKDNQARLDVNYDDVAGTNFVLAFDIA